MSRVSRLFVPAGLFLSIAAFGGTPVVEPNVPVVETNVNMVAGTNPITGDPYLQRQNEGSVAVSTRNPLVMLALSNDYRTVDIPFDPGTRPDGEETGDAWIGVFQSRDAGRTWHSTLLEGYPQQTFSTSPLHGFQAAADPVVRAADHGLFFAAGIVLNRDTNPLSGLFVARFIHNNNSETGDPITPLGVTMIDRGTSGQFIDKPWLAVAPAPNNTPCTVAGQTFSTSQNVYVAYTVFVGGDNNIRTKLMFARSTDCGNTWSAPTKLSEGYPINQGATIAVSPKDGSVYVFWRQFHTTQVGDAILMAKSTDQGQTFSKGSIVANITPFEQPTSIAPLAMRTNAYPSVAIDSTGRLYMVWQSRVGPASLNSPTLNDGRIVLSMSNDGVSWSTPVAIDPNPTNGHQFQPTIIVTGNKVTVAYYDLRDDSTLGRLLPDGSEVRMPEGDLALNPAQPQYVFTTYLAEQAGHRRHTLDVRAAQAPVGATPIFATKRVSRYVFGTPHNAFPKTIDQLQVNPPNFPLFRNGTAPFIGDYIDITGYSNGSSVLHVVWTDNRDVRPPLDGDWTHYTPVGPPNADGTLRTGTFNGQPEPNCIAGQAGMRNQNIYTTRLTEGLFAGAATDAKQLNIQRAFPVFVQNTRKTSQDYNLHIQTPGASFLQTSTLTDLNITVPGRTTATRTVFVSANTNTHASVSILITEINTGTTTPLTTTVVLNPDMSNPDMSNPDMSNPDFSNSNFQTPDMSNPDMSNPDMSNLDLQNRDIANPDFSNPDFSNPDFSNPDMSNPDFSNPDMSNATLSDTTWTASNNGNTTTGYNVKLVSNGPPPGIKTQLIITRLYQTPIDQGCNLKLATQRQVMANIPNPLFSDGGDLLDPLAKTGEGTYWLAPGDKILVTLRVFDPDKTDNVTFNPATEVQAVTVSQPINVVNGQISGTQTVGGVVITTRSVPNGVVGQTYQNTGSEIPVPVVLTATGGVPPYTWAALKGLPAGLAINAQNGTISGIPTTAADSFATFSVTDSAQPPHVATRTLLMHIAQPLAFVTQTANDAVTNASYSMPFAASGGTPPYSWTVGGPNTTFSISSSGLATGTFTQAGTANLFITVSDSATPKQSISHTFSVNVADPVAFASLAMPSVTQGSSISQQLTSSGGIAPIHWALASGALPVGVSLSDSGFLSGAPTSPGTATFTIKITDSSQPTKQTLTSGSLQIVVSAPPSGCGTTVSVLFDNSNTDAVVNQPTNATTFSTNGASYCVDSIWTYHWNGGRGLDPAQVQGTIGLTTNCTTSCTIIGPWPAVGSSGQGGAPNVNWTARPTTNPIVINGTYTVTDSSPATWSQNAKSGGAGFAIVYVRSYTPPIHTATIHLTYNGQPLTPQVQPQMFAKNLGTGVYLDPSQIVWNQNDTVTVTGLLDGGYVIEVAIPKDANTAKYFPGGFWAQQQFTIAGADAGVTMPESRLIHLTAPADNTNSLGTEIPCPASLSIPNPTSITWEGVDPNVTNVTYRYQVDLADCSGTNRQTITSGSTTNLSVALASLTPTGPTQFYQIFLHADSPAQTDVGQIMTVGSDFYGWSLVFTVPPPPTFNVVASLKYNGAAQSLSGANAISVLNTDTNTLVNPNNVVYDGNSTIAMTGLAAGKYAIEVASQEAATALYQPGSFWSDITFDAATASQAGLGIDLQRMIHTTVPIDNQRSYGALQCPPVLALANVSTISVDPIDVPATYRYNIWTYPCGTGTPTQAAAGNFDGTVAAFNQLPLSNPGEYYAMTIDAFSATNNALLVGGIMSAGTNFRRRDLEFVVVPPGLSFNVAPASTTFSVTGNGSVVQINGTVANATATSQTVFLQCFIDQGNQSVGAGGNADFSVTPNRNQAVDPTRNIAESGNAAQAGFQPGPATLRIQLKQGSTIVQTLSFPITLTP